MFEPPLIVQETDPSHSLGLLRAGGERPCDGRAPEECDEFAPSHAKLPVEDEATRGQSCASQQKFAADGRDGSWSCGNARPGWHTGRTLVRGWLCPDRGHKRPDTHDVHDTGEIVGEYVQRHL